MKQTRKNKFRRKRALTREVVVRRVRRTARGIGALLLLAGVSAGFVFAYDCFTQSDQFRVRTIAVSGNQRLDRQAILNAAGIDADTNILALNLTLARKRLLAQPWIADAAIGRDIPSRLHITVREETSLALLATSDGTGYLVNPEGRIFKRADAADANGPWPRVRGIDDGDLPAAGRPVSRGMQAVVELLRLSREAGSPLPYADIAEIFLDREIGLSLTLRESPGDIRLGFGDYRRKAAALQALTAHLNARPDLAGCRMIDLYDINRIVVTLAPDDATSPGHEEVNVAGT